MTRRFLPTAAWLLLVTGTGAATGPGSGRAAPAPAAGVTPGGLLYSVSPASRRLRLLAPDGTERAVLALQPDETLVLGVADDGSRVTSRSALPTRSWLEEDALEKTARFVFRDARGNVLATREARFLSETQPAVLGGDVYAVRRQSRAFVLFRISAAEEATVLLRLPVERILTQTGKAEEVKVHASPAGVVLEIRGPYRAVYVDVSRPEKLVSPDPALECGSGSSYPTVFPGRPRGIDRVAVRARGTRTGGSPGMQLERLDETGHLAGLVELGSAREVHPLAGGDFLALSGTEAVLLDERGHELSHVPFSARGDAGSPELAREAEAQRRLAALGEKAGGGDWAELAIASGRISFEGIEHARRDPSGVLTRLARVPDGSEDVARARQVLSGFLAYRGFTNLPAPPHGMPAPGKDPAKAAAAMKAAWTEILSRGEALVAAGAPRWFSRVFALSLLEERKREAPPWAFAALAEAVASGELERRLPEDVFSDELAEMTSAVDRDRIVRFERGGEGRAGRPSPGLSEELPFDPFDEGPGGPDYHVPPGRFAPLLLSCLSGAGPAGVRAVVEALMEPALARRWREQPGMELEEDEEEPDFPADRKREEKPEESTGAIASLLLEARRSDDPGLRVGAQLLSPYYALPLDAARWRADVLAKPGLERTAANALLLDRSLASDAWTGLFADTLLSARKASADPLACARMPFAEPGPEPGDSPDPYCTFLMSTLMYGGDPFEDPSAPAAGRSRDVASFTRSAAAPPEIRLHAKLGRAFSGTATAADLLDIWRARELPLGVRSMAIRYNRKETPRPELAAEWQRELREGSLTPAEEVSLLEALKQADKDEAARLAAERWESGKVPLGEGNARTARAFTTALDRETVAARPRLIEALKQALDDEGAGPDAAALLARLGEPAALPRLVAAIRTGCLG